MRATLLSLIWFAMAYAYWGRAVPLKPTCVFSKGNDGLAWGFQADGKLSVVHFDETVDQSRFQPLKGPIELWDVQKGERVAQWLSSADVFECMWLDHGVVLTIRNGELLVIDPKTGITRHSLPFQGTKLGARWISADGSQMLVGDGASLRLFDLEKGKVKWENPGRFQLHSSAVGQDFACVTPLTTPSSPAMVLNLQTGLEDSRFAHLGRIQAIHVCGECPVVLIDTGACAVCDSRTGRKICTLPPICMPNRFWLSADESELHFSMGSEQGPSQTVRISLSDGSVIGRSPEPMRVSVTSLSPARSRYAVERVGRYQTTLDTLIQPVVNSIEMLLRRRASTSMYSGGECLLVTDTSTSRVVGFTPFGGPSVAKDGSGFIRQTAEKVFYYSLPPARNWRWLIDVGVLPPISVIAIRKAYLRLRRGRSPALPQASSALPV